MLPAQLPERLLEEREQAHRRLGNDRRRPSPGQEEADLTEKLALPELRLYRPVLLDPSYALQDREQLVGVVALACARTATGSSARLGIGSIRPGSTTA